jgi:multiple sugar transport system permease protein
MVSTSLKASNEVLIMPPKWIPDKLMWENYKVALSSAPFKRYFINSVFVTTMITMGELITTILAAYAFSKIEFKGREILFSILLGTMMVPGEVLIIPNFVTLSQLGWIDTYKALIIPWCASVFAIFLLRQYFLGIPEELYKAAKIDGCCDFKFLWTIMVPLAKPAIITIALFKIINSWNAFMWPLIVTNSENMRTLPVALSAFSSEVGTEYHYLMAAAAMITLPMIIIYMILQKYIIEGVSKSGIKG